MAFFPCSNHHAPYTGPSSAVYPAIVNGTVAERGKLRMCTVCFVEYMQAVGSHLVEIVDEATAQATPGCYLCGAKDEAAQLAAIFVTAYPKGQEPKNFYGRVCFNDRPKAVEQFLLK